ncbi:MAG: YkgJ family cysteine cluster protein [Acidobacteriota bacterium]
MRCLFHEDTWVWVDDDEWYVQVDRKCKHLQSNNLCGIYETRPQICRDYAIPEKLESPDEPLCDYFSKDIDHDHEFRTMDELEAYAAIHLSKREAKRRARSEAAKKAWAKKKMVQGTAKRRAG